MNQDIKKLNLTIVLRRKYYVHKFCENNPGLRSSQTKTQKPDPQFS